MRLETALLACLLLSHPDHFVGISDLAIAIWGADGGPLRPQLTIKVLVHRLRQAGVEIEVAHGRGYSKRPGFAFKGYRIRAQHRGAKARKIDRIAIPQLKRRRLDYLIAPRRRSIGVALTLFR